MIERRSFLTGLVSFVAAPAIVRMSSLMPIRGMLMASLTEYDGPTVTKIDVLYGIWIVSEVFNSGNYWVSLPGIGREALAQPLPGHEGLRIGDQIMRRNFEIPSLEVRA